MSNVCMVSLKSVLIFVHRAFEDIYFLHVPAPLIQWSATVLSIHPWTDLIWYPLIAALTLPTRLAAMWADTST